MSEQTDSIVGHRIEKIREVLAGAGMERPPGIDVDDRVAYDQMVKEVASLEQETTLNGLFSDKKIIAVAQDIIEVRERRKEIATHLIHEGDILPSQIGDGDGHAFASLVKNLERQEIPDYGARTPLSAAQVVLEAREKSGTETRSKADEFKRDRELVEVGGR